MHEQRSIQVSTRSNNQEQQQPETVCLKNYPSERGSWRQTASQNCSHWARFQTNNYVLSEASLLAGMDKYRQRNTQVQYTIFPQVPKYSTSIRSKYLGIFKDFIYP